MLKRFAFAMALAAMTSPVPAETTPKTDEKAAAAEEKPAEATTPAAGESAADETKPETSPEEKAAIAEAKARAMGEGEPRALIVDVLGFTEPQIDAFDELNDGASILLAADAELALTYYPTCEDLTIRGGRISISGDKMTLDEGELVSRSEGQCPGAVKMSPADVVNASVVTRSVAAKPIISTLPRVIGITGPDAGSYTKISVYGPDGIVFEAAVEGRGAKWPQDIDALDTAKQYTIVLTGPEMQMFAARVTPEEGASPVTVFRIK